MFRRKPKTIANKTRIVLDFEDVVADVNREVLSRLEMPADYVRKSENYLCTKKKLDEINEAQTFADFEPMGYTALPGTHSMIAAIEKESDVYIWSSIIADEMVDWIVTRTPLSSARLIICEHIKMVHADLFVTAKMVNAIKWGVTNPGKLPYILNKPWNGRNYTRSKMPRINSLVELLEC